MALCPQEGAATGSPAYACVVVRHRRVYIDTSPDRGRLFGVPKVPLRVPVIRPRRALIQRHRRAPVTIRGVESGGRSDVRQAHSAAPILLEVLSPFLLPPLPPLLLLLLLLSSSLDLLLLGYDSRHARLLFAHFPLDLSERHAFDLLARV